MKKRKVVFAMTVLIAFVLLWFWLGTPNSGQKESDLALFGPMQASAGLGAPPGSISNEPAGLNPTSTPPAGASGSQPGQTNLFSYYNMAKQVHWLDTNDAKVDFNEIQKKALKVTKESFQPTPIRSREDAILHLNNSVSMAQRPSVAFEDEKFYYFSGGTMVRSVTDFSTGFVVSKETGEIITW